MDSRNEVQQLLRQLKGGPADPEMKARLLEMYRRWLAETKLQNKLRSENN